MFRRCYSADFTPKDAADDEPAQSRVNPTSGELRYGRPVRKLLAVDLTSLSRWKKSFSGTSTSGSRASHRNEHRFRSASFTVPARWTDSRKKPANLYNHTI